MTNSLRILMSSILVLDILVLVKTVPNDGDVYLRETAL
jgi:hypothetical protein